MFDPTCEFCGKPISNANAPGTYWRVVAWIEKRTGGGAHGVSLASEPSGFAHKSCIDLETLRRGLRGPFQETSLF